MNIDSLKHLGDGVSLSVLWATLIGVLPDATAILSFVWICIRLYETKTVQTLINWLLGKEKEDG